MLGYVDDAVPCVIERHENPLAIVVAATLDRLLTADVSITAGFTWRHLSEGC